VYCTTASSTFEQTLGL